MYIQDSLYVIKQIAFSKHSILTICDHFIVIFSYIFNESNII